MNTVSAKEQTLRRLPKLAAMALVFWGLSSSSHLDAAPVWLLQSDMTAQDAALYRAAFAAQEKADWTFADKALAQVADKRLVGHVLADRYMHRAPALDEAKLWLSTYSFLPEAEAIYAKTKGITGFSAAKIEKPMSVDEWEGSDGFSSPSGFRSVNDNGRVFLKTSAKTEINAALRRHDPTKARLLLATALNKRTLPIAHANDLTSRIAAAFFYEGNVDSARSMARIAAKSGAPLALWIEGLSAWKQHDFGTSAHSFTELAETAGLSPWNQSAAAYWAYRATSRLGDKTQSYHWLAEAAKYPQTFYGVMASNLMGHQVERSWKMPELDAKYISVLTSQPFGWRALALVQVGRSDLAESQLRRLLSDSPHETRMPALALAEKAGMPSLLLQLSGVASVKNGKPLDAALYPLPPWEPVNGYTVDRALIYAIMRHESQFDTAAVSARGACGLMQIMPSTARHIANENKLARGIKSNCSDRLLDPAINVDMGQKYVRILADQPLIGDNLLFLLAAYNGGPGNLAHWIASGDRSDPLLFIEGLPSHETRDYVQQVMLHYWMYRSRLSQPDNAMASLAQGQWPRYVVSDLTKRAAAQGLELASLETAKLTKTR